jgi:hypothetical protein
MAHLSHLILMQNEPGFDHGEDLVIQWALIIFVSPAKQIPR